MVTGGVHGNGRPARCVATPTHPRPPMAGHLITTVSSTPRPRLIPASLANVESVRGLGAATVNELSAVEGVAELTGRARYAVRAGIEEGRLAAVRSTGTGSRCRLPIARGDRHQLLGSGLAGRACTAPSAGGSR